MARSENQGLQIAVIIFAFLTIALSVATFYFFNDASTQYADALAEKQKAQEKDTVLRTQIDKSNAFLETIGHPNETPIPTVQAKRDELAALFGGLQLANGKNYVNIIQGLKASWDQANQERKDQKQKMEDLEKQLRATEANYAAEVKKITDKYEADRKRADAEVVTLNGKDVERENTLKQLRAELDKVRADLVKANDDKQKELLAKDKEIAALLKQVADVIKERYEKENWVFERPDASVVSVNPKEQTVNIDVGRTDHLRLNIQFAVFKRGETNVYKRTKKGTVSVTRFIGDNMAEARIVDSTLKDPILAGDVVYTPTWTPGMQETFVLAGDFDVNGDRKPDNELMHTLVNINGGKIEDEVTTSTRYLLKGDAPPAADKERREKFDKLKKRAEELSIKVMGLQEFIEYTGSGETLRQLQKQGSKATNPILKEGTRTLGKSGFKTREASEGGARRFEPGGAGSPASAAGGNEAAKKQPPRRPSGGQ